MTHQDHSTTHIWVKSCLEALSSSGRTRPLRPSQKTLVLLRVLPAPPHHTNVFRMVHISRRWIPPRYCAFLQSMKHASSNVRCTQRTLLRAPSRQEYLASFYASYVSRLRTSRCRSRRPSGQQGLLFRRQAALKSSQRQWARPGMCPLSKIFFITTIKVSALANFPLPRTLWRWSY